MREIPLKRRVSVRSEQHKGRLKSREITPPPLTYHIRPTHHGSRKTSRFNFVRCYTLTINDDDGVAGEGKLGRIWWFLSQRLIRCI